MFNLTDYCLSRSGIGRGCSRSTIANSKVLDKTLTNEHKNPP